VTYALGGYGVAYFANDRGWPIWAAAIIAIALCGLLGAIFELLLYRPLRARNAGTMVIFVASLGAMILLTSLIVLKFGPGLIVLSNINGTPVHFGSAVLTRLQLAAIGISVLAVGVFFVYWYVTWGGRSLRAVTSNPTRAKIAGFRPPRSYLTAMVIGSAIGGLAGVLVQINEGSAPEMIMTGALIASAAVLIGGFGSVVGATLGGLLLAMSMNIGIWKLPSKWQDAIAFGVLLAFIMFRPRGLMGEKLKRAQI
jgi:branched-chain amino acid transport system permease protein